MLVEIAVVAALYWVTGRLGGSMFRMRGCFEPGKPDEVAICWGERPPESPGPLAPEESAPAPPAMAESSGKTGKLYRFFRALGYTLV